MRSCDVEWKSYAGENLEERRACGVEDIDGEYTPCASRRARTEGCEQGPVTMDEEQNEEVDLDRKLKSVLTGEEGGG